MFKRCLGLLLLAGFPQWALAKPFVFREPTELHLQLTIPDGWTADRDSGYLVFFKSPNEHHTMGLLPMPPKKGLDYGLDAIFKLHSDPADMDTFWNRQETKVTDLTSQSGWFGGKGLAGTPKDGILSGRAKLLHFQDLTSTTRDDGTKESYPSHWVCVCASKGDYTEALQFTYWGSDEHWLEPIQEILRSYHWI